MQFVVRLHEDIHAELSGVPTGMGMRTVTGRQMLASSTYFHERIHWWQHAGSTLGLFLSLAYPAQTHVNYTRLKAILDAVGPVKSLRRLDQTNARSFTAGMQKELSIVLNNWHDIEFCRWLALVPELIEAAVKDPYFESLGHAYSVTWGNGVLLISEALNPTRSFVPDPYEWEAALQDLRDHRVEDFYYGSSPVRLARIGARLIFEGQARFSQLQHLHFGAPDTADWRLFDDLGMLQPDYTAAFRAFLTAVGAPWPDSPGGPEVALFLAICDVAINPTEGFPFPVSDFPSWRMNLDPGIRFLKLCEAAAAHPDLLTAVRAFTRSEYEEVTETLTRSLDWPSPLASCARVRGWERQPSFVKLEEEDARFIFDNRDLPVRVFTARYLAFQRDKLRYPELLVWPGAFTGGRDHEHPLDRVLDVFGQHEPLFVDVPGGEVRPALLAGRPHEAIYHTFNAFHAYSASYQLVRQWHVADGPFDLDFGWLTPDADPVDTDSWAKDIFASAFGKRIDEFEILPAETTPSETDLSDRGDPS
jgi:hypothetical protein